MAFDAFVLIKCRPLPVGSDIVALVAAHALPMRVGLRRNGTVCRAACHDFVVLAVAGRAGAVERLILFALMAVCTDHSFMNGIQPVRGLFVVIEFEEGALPAELAVTCLALL